MLPVERYRQTKKRRAPRGEEAGPSKRAPESGPSDPYYEYHSDSDPLLSPADLKADRERFDSATEEQRQTVTTLMRQMALICHRSPQVEPVRMLQQILCTSRPYFPGMVKDPRTVFEGPCEVDPTDIVNASDEVVGTFWHRGSEAGIRAQSPSTIGIEALQYYLHVGKVPLAQLAHPDFQAWVVQAQLLEATGEPGEPFVVSVFCGSEKPTTSVLLGPVCNEANQLRQRGSLTADIRTRAVLADAKARALVKETCSQTAYHGCTKCTIEGVKIGRQISFHDNTASQPRTHASFSGHVYDVTHHKSTPTRRATPLELLGIDLIKDVCVADDRHLLHLGAVYNFYTTFTVGLYKATKMPENALYYLHCRLCKVWFPHEREHKQFTTHIAMWPPSMWAYFLDVVGCVVLKPVLQPEDYELYCWLHFAVAICKHKRFNNMFGYARVLFQEFVTKYSERVGFVPCDIHNLLHVVDEMQDFKSLPQISTNRCESALSSLSLNVDTAHGPWAVQQVGTALMLRECARRSPGSFHPIPTHNGRRVAIRPKFLLRSEAISQTDADSWFLTATGKVVKFESASVDNLGLVVLGRPLHQQKKTFTHTERDVPAELNVFVTNSKTTFSKHLEEYRAADMISILCVVDLKKYTSFVPLFESLPEC